MKMLLSTYDVLMEPLKPLRPGQLNTQSILGEKFSLSKRNSTKAIPANKDEAGCLANMFSTKTISSDGCQTGSVNSNRNELQQLKLGEEFERLLSKKTET